MENNVSESSMEITQEIIVEYLILKYNKEFKKGMREYLKIFNKINDLEERLERATTRFNQGEAHQGLFSASYKNQLFALREIEIRIWEYVATKHVRMMEQQEIYKNLVGNYYTLPQTDGSN